MGQEQVSLIERCPKFRVDFTKKFHCSCFVSSYCDFVNLLMKYWSISTSSLFLHIILGRSCSNYWPTFAEPSYPVLCQSQPRPQQGGPSGRKKLRWKREREREGKRGWLGNEWTFLTNNVTRHRRIVPLFRPKQGDMLVSVAEVRWRDLLTGLLFSSFAKRKSSRK